MKKENAGALFLGFAGLTDAMGLLTYCIVLISLDFRIRSFSPYCYCLSGSIPEQIIDCRSILDRIVQDQHNLKTVSIRHPELRPPCRSACQTRQQYPLRIREAEPPL